MYEVHITCHLNDSMKAQEVADTFGWKTSEITRDIILGGNPYLYLTAHYKTKHEAFEKLNEAVFALVKLDANVIRQKIELIIFDTKTGIGVK